MLQTLVVIDFIGDAEFFLKEKPMRCPQCDEETLQHMHDLIYDIPGTHMPGSERFECQCGFYAIPGSSIAEEYNLEFSLDIFLVVN